MLTCEGRVATLGAWALAKPSPCEARRSSVGVSTRRLPAKPRASARSVSMVTRRTSGLLGHAAVRWPPPPLPHRTASKTAAPARARRSARTRREPGNIAVLKKKPPGKSFPAVSKGATEALEGDPGAEAQDSRTLDLTDRVRGALGQAVVSLEHRVLVGEVEDVHRERQCRSLRDVDDLLTSQVELVDVLIPETVRGYDDDVPGDAVREP